MSEKIFNTRIQQKHDIEVNWSKAVNFIPKIGEVIVYDPDENHAAARVKVGDGVKTVVELPFISEQADWEVNDETSAAYVKNRTHYNLQPKKNILFETTVTGGRGYVEEFSSLIAGRTYEVSIDEQTYICQAYQTLNDNNNASVVITLDGGTDITFRIYHENPLPADMSEASGYQMITDIYLDDLNEHIVKLTEIIDDFKTLNDEYIPASIARINDVPGMKKKNTYDDILSITVFGSEIKNKQIYSNGLMIAGESALVPGKTYVVNINGTIFDVIAKNIGLSVDDTPVVEIKSENYSFSYSQHWGYAGGYVFKSFLNLIGNDVNYITIGTKEDKYNLIPDQAIPENIVRATNASHQTLVTNIDGKAIWQDKTHYDDRCDFVIEWDGNTEGLDRVGQLYKITSEVIPWNYLVGTELTYKKGYKEYILQEIIQSSLESTLGSFDCFNYFNEFYIVYKHYTSPITGYTLSPGIWINQNISKISRSYGSLIQLDEKFIPDTIARIDDLPVAITPDRIDEICGIEPVMTLVVDEDGDAVINAGFPDDEGNLTI